MKSQIRAVGRLLTAGTVMCICILPATAAQKHKVQSGDSLWTISHKYDVTVADLCRANHLKPDAVLQLGDILVIPGGTAAAPKATAASRSYTVKKGDTVSTIAEKLGVSTELLLRANRLSDHAVLQIGQQLYVPTSGKANAPKASESPYGYIAEGNVNVRKGPGTRYQRVAQADQGIRVKVFGKYGDWYKVAFNNGTTGWVSTDLVKYDGTPREIAYASEEKATKAASASPIGYVTDSNVNVRQSPALSSQRVAVAAQGTRLKLYARAAGWIKVEFPNGTIGWIHSQFVKTDDLDRVKVVAVPAPKVIAAKPKPATAPKVAAAKPQPATKVAAASPATPPKGRLARTSDVFAGPGDDYGLAAIGGNGVAVLLTGKCNGWYRVEFPNGRTGWVRHDAVSTSDGDRVFQVSAPEKATAAVPTPVAGPTTEVAKSEPAPAATPMPVGAPGPKVTPAPAQPDNGDTAVASSGEGSGTADSSAGRPGWISGAVVNVRKSPDNSALRIAQTTQGVAVRIVDTAKGWYKVAFDNGVVGWVASWLVSTHAESKDQARHEHHERSYDTSVPDNIGSDLVAKAMEYRGVRYARGGTSVSRGFDCSGLVYRVLESFGIHAPRTSRDLYDVGRPVSRDELQKGDLVFFRNTYRRGISHVGIYIGDGKFIHAATEGKGVTVGDLNSEYYASRWAGARRLK